MTYWYRRAQLEKANPYHDALGRFTTADNAVFVSLFGAPKVTNPMQSLPSTNISGRKVSFDSLSRDEQLEFADRIGTHTRQVFKTLSTEESASITDYSGQLYRPINRYLRYGEPATGFNVETEISRLDAVFLKTKSSEDLSVFRGMKFDAGRRIWDAIEAGDLKVGSVYPDKGYQSTSLSENFAVAWANPNKGVYFEATVPKGSPALFLHHNAMIPSEKEVLLRRGTSWIITGIEEITDRLGGEVKKIKADLVFDQLFDF